MDNAQKAIMIGVGLFITIIIIAAVMVIVNMGQGLVNQGTQEVSKLSSEMQRSMTQEYDNKTKTGAEVLAAVKKYYNDPDRVIIVVNKSSTPVQAGGLYATYSRGNISGNITENKANLAAISSFSDITNSDNYIVPTARYKSKVLTQNDAVVGIVFEKQ